MNPIEGSEELSQSTILVYEQAQDTSTKSRVTTIVGLIFAMVLAFGGIYMMGQAFDNEEYGLYIFGGGLLIDALGFWLAFYLIPKLDGDRVIDQSKKKADSV